jgi:hypothetical protein
MLQTNRTYCVVPSMQVLNEYGGPALVHAVNQPVLQFTRGYRPETPLACGSGQSAQHRASTLFRIEGNAVCAERRTHGGPVVDVDAGTDLSLHKRFTGACVDG